MSELITLIVVDYKTMEKTVRYLEMCMEKAVPAEDLHMVIVDNSEGGRDSFNVLEKLTGRLPEDTGITIKEKPIFKGKIRDREFLYVAAWQNLGYAKGNNLGAAAAGRFYPKDAGYLFSNNDLRMEGEVKLSRLMEPIKAFPDVAAVGPKIIGTDGKAQTPWKKTGVVKQMFLRYLNLLLPKFCKINRFITDLDTQATEESRYVYWLTGCFLLVDAGVFQRIGGFDEETFLYCEEMILAEKLLCEQKRMYYENSVTLIHEHGQTMKKTWKGLDSIRFQFESSLYYFKKYRGMSAFTEALVKIHFKAFVALFSFKNFLSGRKKPVS